MKHTPEFNKPARGVEHRLDFPGTEPTPLMAPARDGDDGLVVIRKTTAPAAPGKVKRI